MVKRNILAELEGVPEQGRVAALIDYARARCEFMRCPFTAWLLMDEAYMQRAYLRDAAMAQFKKWCRACNEPRSVNNAARFVLRREGLL